MSASENVRSYNAGKSGYSRHAIQPRDIWKGYSPNPRDADTVKRVLRSKEGEARTPGYEKIIHICKCRIAELSKEVSRETKAVAPAGAEKPVEDEESDDTTVFCPDGTTGPPMLHTGGAKRNGKYAGYPVSMAGDVPYMYSGVDAAGGHLYVGLSGRGHRYCTEDRHPPDRTSKLKDSLYSGNHGSPPKIGYAGTLHGKHGYIITCDGRPFRYSGMGGGKFYCRDMSARRADGTYPGFSGNVKLENKAIQFTL